MKANFTTFCVVFVITLVMADIFHHLFAKIQSGSFLERQFVKFYVFVVFWAYACATLFNSTIRISPDICPLHIHPDTFDSWCYAVATRIVRTSKF